MHSRYLVSGLPRVLPPLPPSPAPPCLPCVEGRQRATPHSSSFPPTEAPLQTLHMDVWGPALIRGQGHEQYFLLVVDDYTRYTTVFPLHTKAYCAEHGIRQTFTLPASPQQNGVAERRIGLVMEVACTSMIHAAAPHFLWPFAVQYAAHLLNLWPCVSAPETSPTLRWTGEVGDATVFWVWGCQAFVRDTSVHKLSSCAAPCVFLGLVPDAPGWQFYHPTSRRVFFLRTSLLTSRYPFTVCSPTALRRSPPPPLFLTPVVPSVDPLPPQGPSPSGVSQVNPIEPVEVAVDSGHARGTASGGAETGGAGTGGAEPGGAETGGAEPGGAEPGGAKPGVAKTGGAEPGGAEPGGAATDRAEPGGAPSSQQLREWYSRRCSLRCGAAGAGGSAGVGAGGVAGAVSRQEPPSPERLREWYARRCSLQSGAPSTGVPPTGGPGTAGAGAAGGATGAGVGAGGAGAAGAIGRAEDAELPGVGVAGAGAGGTDARPPAGAGADGAAGAHATGGTGVGTPGAAGGATGVGAATGGSGAVSAGSGGASRPRPYFVPLLQLVLGQLPPTCPAPSLECPPPVQSQSQLQPTSPLPAPSPYTGLTRGLTERREPKSHPVSPESRSASPVRAARTGPRVTRQRPLAVPDTHQMTLRLSTAPQRVPLPSPPASSLPALADPESDSLPAASPTVTRLLATVVTDPSFESATAFALVAELVDFAAHCRLDYAASLVAESESVCPPSVGGECALGTDVLEDRQEELECFAAAVPHLVSMVIAHEGDPDAPDIPTPRSYVEAIAGEYSSQWQSAMDSEMAYWKFTGTYVDEVPPAGANIVSGMWIFRVMRPPASPPVFKARCVARGFSQREGVDFFQTFSPTPKMTTLWVLLHVAAQRDYELHSLHFSTAFLQGSLHEEIWLRRPPGFTGLFPSGTQWSLWRPVYGLRQAPCEWHDTLRTTLVALGFAPSTADPSLFLRTDNSLPLF
ncbi:unnamed protein product [Closterium sp. NIES-64]|nr:unnamed protein product [Closterium sp. NIES-64]